MCADKAYDVAALVSVLWLKQTGPLRKVKLEGLPKVDWLFLFRCAAFNLLRIPKLTTQFE